MQLKRSTKYFPRAGQCHAGNAIRPVYITLHLSQTVYSLGDPDSFLYRSLKLYYFFFFFSCSLSLSSLRFVTATIVYIYNNTMSFFTLECFSSAKLFAYTRCFFFFFLAIFHRKKISKFCYILLSSV